MTGLMPTQSTKQQNRNWAYAYLAVGFGFLIFGIVLNEDYWLYTFSLVMFALAGWRLFWLDKKLRN